VTPILFTSLDGSATLTAAASQHDIVINTASGFHTGAAKALILGLGQPKRNNGKDVFFIYTTSTSNTGDKPITKEYYEPRILSDKDDLYSYLKKREAAEQYSRCTTDLVSIDTGIEEQVKTIYGLGSGLFNKKSIQLLTLIRTAIKRG
jgi:hypothetical protein